MPDMTHSFLVALNITVRLVEIVKAELQAGGRCCHVFAVYTETRNVTAR